MKRWGILLVFMLAIFLFPTMSEASTVREVKVVNADYLGVKAYASPSVANIATLKRGDIAIVSGVTNGWAKVQSKSITGYVNASFLKEITPAIKVIHVQAGLAVRQYPTRSADITATWQKNLLIEDYGTVGAGWNVVKYGNAVGYAAASSLTLPKISTQYVNVDTIIVRNAATKSATQVATLPKNTQVTVHGTIAGWAYISAGKARGYVVANQLRTSATVLKGERIHQGDLSKRVRFTTILRDVTTGKNVKAHFISYGDQSGRGTQETLWAGMNIGDLYYKGDFKIGLQAEDDKYVYVQPYLFTNYTYNKTRELVYKIPAKTVADTDLLVVSQIWSANYREGQVYYVTNGQLSRAGTVSYTHKPRSIGQNEYQMVDYYAEKDRGFSFDTFKVNTKTSSISLVSRKRYFNEKWDEGARLYNLWYQNPNYVVK